MCEGICFRGRAPDSMRLAVRRIRSGLGYDRTAAMTRKSTRQTGVRARIAAAAARIMAEDGIDDFALAKRKAARQVGAVEGEALPANDEIEAELRSYLALYQAEEHPERLAEPRRAGRHASAPAVQSLSDRAGAFGNRRAPFGNRAAAIP